MTAVLVPTANEAEWLEARRQGVTASEIAILMGLSPYSSPYALYHQKLGILPSQDDSPEMERGRVLEPYVSEKFAAAHPEFFVLGTGRDLFRHDGRAWQMATPDRVVHGLVEVDRCTCGAGPGSYAGMHERGCGWELDSPVAVLECKVDGGSDEWGEEGTGEIPVHYRAQAIWQMDVMDVSKVYVDCLDPARWRIRSYVIEHDPAGHIGDSTGEQPQGDCGVCDDLALMRDAARDFLGRIDRQEPPDVDWRPATIGALKQLHPSVTDETAEIGPQLADRYEAAARNAKHWEKRKHLYEARIRERAGSAHRIVRAGPDQVPVARRDVYEVKAHERKASTVDKLVLTPPKPKKEKTS